MLSILCFITLTLICLLAYRLIGRQLFLAAGMGVAAVAVIELIVYGYFLILIAKGACFFLIGNQPDLDALMKLRLSYSTYFVQARPDMVYHLDDDLGWTVGKNKRTSIYQTNAQGIRASREYPLKPGASTLRLAAFGDSFIFCDHESNPDTWTAQLEAMAGNLEVLNFGVSGYGLGQSYLRYLKDGLSFQPDIILINYITLSGRDELDARQLAESNNLRQAHFYRPQFWLQDGMVRSRVTTPYDLFDPAFRQQHIYGPLGVDEQQGVWSWPIFRYLNTGLLIKNRLLPMKLVESADVASMADNHELNQKMLQNLIQTAKAQGTYVIFFYGAPVDELPEGIRRLLVDYQEHVLYVNSLAAIDAQLPRTDKAYKKTLRNHSDHFTPEGNLYYARAVLDVIKQQRYKRGTIEFRFDSDKQSFITE